MIPFTFVLAADGKNGLDGPRALVLHPHRRHRRIDDAHAALRPRSQRCAATNAQPVAARTTTPVAIAARRTRRSGLRLARCSSQTTNASSADGGRRDVDLQEPTVAQQRADDGQIETARRADCQSGAAAISAGDERARRSIDRADDREHGAEADVKDQVDEIEERRRRVGGEYALLTSSSANAAATATRMGCVRIPRQITKR